MAGLRPFRRGVSPSVCLGEVAACVRLVELNLACPYVFDLFGNYN